MHTHNIIALVLLRIRGVTFSVGGEDVFFCSQEVFKKMIQNEAKDLAGGQALKNSELGQSSVDGFEWSCYTVGIEESLNSLIWHKWRNWVSISRNYNI